MGMSQAVSSDIGPMVGPPPIVKRRSGSPGRMTLPASRPVNSPSIAGPQDRGNEWAVVQQAIAGNADAQERLFAGHTRRLYRTVFALLNNKEDAEDALQEGLCKAFTSLRSFQGRSSFSTWLTRIVINSALMARRRRSAHPEASLDETAGRSAQTDASRIRRSAARPGKTLCRDRAQSSGRRACQSTPARAANGHSTSCYIRLFRAAFGQCARCLGERYQIANLSGAIEAGR